MAHWLDWKIGAPTFRFWTDDELALLRSGQPVPYRTANACKLKRRALGFHKGPGNYLARAPYEPPTPVPGKIPWPSWWRRAHLMRVEGYKITQICRILGLHEHSVRCALYPKFHETHLRESRRRKQKPASLAQERERPRDRDPVREKLRRFARLKWRAAGGKPNDLEKLYREYGCL